MSAGRRPIGRTGGVVVGVASIALLTVALVPVRDRSSTATDALAFVVPVVIAAFVGGRIPALVTAVVAATSLEVFFLPPYNTFKIDFLDDAVALAVFIAVALAVGTLVALEGERRIAAQQQVERIETLYAERRTLEGEKRALELVDDYRAALLRSVSHDLRTPLVTIRAVTSDLRAGAVYDDDVRDDLLDLVGDEADRLDRLVANLLSLSRIEAGSLRPDLQAVPLDELFTARVRKLNRLLRGAHVQLDVPFTLPLVEADYTLTEQVLTNLLENAARHSPDGGVIRVRARARDNMVEVAVTDEGPGVAEAERATIFEPFSRGEGSNSSGIGLAICRAIVQAHGGTLSVETANGGGAQFVFTLPVHRQ